MAEIFDNLCRTLATPMPRSRALKLILGGLASAALAPFAFGDDCTGREQCGTNNANHLAACCPPGQMCCLTVKTSDARPVCCSPALGCVSPQGGDACAKPSPKQT